MFHCIRAIHVHLGPDGAGSAVRAVLVKRVGGSRYLAVFFDTNGTVGLPGYDGGREQPHRPETHRFELGSSRLRLTERYAASIRQRLEGSVSWNAMIDWRLDAVTSYAPA